MATIAARDTIEGSSVVNSSDGLTITRRFLVQDLDGDASMRILNALLCDGIPQRGTFHESINGMICDTVSANPLSSGQCEVICVYKVLNTSVVPDESQPPLISVGSTVQSAETNQDINGKLLHLPFTVQTSNTDGSVTTRDEDYYGNAEIQVPHMLYHGTRREKFSPFLKAQRYVGRVNRSGFLNGQPRTWLCTRIEGTSSDGGKSYQVDYEFQFNPNTWDVTVVAVDPATGAPPADNNAENLAKGLPVLLSGEREKDFQMYEEVDFGALSI